MSIEEQLEVIVRRVVREELAARSEAEDLTLLTAQQVADVLSYTDTHPVYRLKREGKLEAVVLGNQTLRFKRSVVRRFIQERVA